MSTDATLGRVEHLELIVFGLLVGTAALAVLANVIGVPVPDHAGAGRRRHRAGAGHAVDRAGARDRPAASSCRRCSTARPSSPRCRDLRSQRPAHRAAVDRGGPRHDVRGRRGRARGHRARMGGVVRARRHRLAHRRGRAGGDPAPARGAAAAAHDRRGREPHQRLDRARALQRGGGRRGQRHVLAGRGERALRAQRRRWPGNRTGGGRGDPFRAIAHRRSAHRDHDLAAVRLRRLSPGRGARGSPA